MTMSYVLCFDGQSTWVDCGSLDLASSDYTIEAWFQARTGGGALFEAAAPDLPHAGNILPGVSLCLDASGALTCAHASQAASEHRVSFITPASYRDGEWHHVALLKKGTRVSLYVDGSRQGSMAGAASLPGPLSVSLGRRAAALQPTRALSGALAEVRVWSNARSDDEIRADLRASLAAAQDGLLRNFRLGEGGGRRVSDCSAHGVTGTVHGSYVWREVPVPWKPAEAAPPPAEAKREEPEQARQESPDPASMLQSTTGLEDYGRWKALYADRTGEGDPPFRRGRVWA